MLILLGTTITASFFDSLNPSAIAQQMLLQAMTKNKRHIWFFILGIGLANLAMGLAVYYGVATWVSQLISAVTSVYPLYVYGTELCIGLVFLALGVRLLKKVWHNRNTNDINEENTLKSPAQLSPLSLFLMGAAFCAVELTSALPYFGFLAMLAGYNLVFPLVICFILLYCFVYVFPLILLYFGYNKLQGTMVIKRLEHILHKVSLYIVPGALSLLSALLIFHGVYSLV